MTEAEQDTFNVRFSNFFEDFYSAESTPMALIAAKARRTTAQNQNGAGVETTVIFDSEDYDYGGFWDISTPDRLIVPSGLGGLYIVKGNFELGNIGSSANRIAYLYVNANVVLIREISGHALRTGYSMSGDVELVAGDEVTLRWNTVGVSNGLVTDGVDATLSLFRVPDGA